MPYKDIKRENDSTSIPSFKSMTKAELEKKIYSILAEEFKGELITHSLIQKLRNRVEEIKLDLGLQSQWKVKVDWNGDKVEVRVFEREDKECLCDYFKKYLMGDCKLCKHRKGLNRKFPKHNIGLCIECDRGNEMNWELDVEALKEKVNEN